MVGLMKLKQHNMSTILIVLLSLVVSWLIVFVLYKIKEAQDKKDRQLFFIKLEAILTNGKPLEDRRNEAFELCRMTKGEAPAGAYMALSDFR
jgi:hypothetical protein